VSLSSDSCWLAARTSFAEGLGPHIKLRRTQTIMQGASPYDFRYKRQKD